MSSLASRVVVAAVLLPLLVAVVYLGGWWLLALGALGGLLALHELYRMARELRPLVLAGYVGLVLALLGVELGGVAWMLGGILASLLVSFALYGLSDVRPSATASFGVTLLGVVWVAAGIGLLLHIRDLPEHGFWALLAVLFAVFAADTAAFFVGRALGRRKLAPAISPGKSWEGVVAGVAAAMVATYLLLYRDREAFLSSLEMLVLGA
ncbi:MAG: phosphatidate cytidylyltransferase, partial [Gaiellaceae bacterium]|nr:phosphatidate cytidylyltransferase [Gaiellaceae bacterium]